MISIKSIKFIILTTFHKQFHTIIKTKNATTDIIPFPTTTQTDSNSLNNLQQVLIGRYLK